MGEVIMSETEIRPTALPDELVPKVFLGNAETLQKIIDIIPSPVFVKDSQHRWVLVNDALTEFHNAPRDRILGKTDFDLMPEAQAELFWAGDEEILRQGGLREYEVKVQISSGGGDRYIVTRKARLMIEDAQYLIAVVNDVTKYRQAEAHSRFVSLHDGLTSLPNRANFYETLEHLVDAPGDVAVMLIDLDGFKAVNDTHGHEVGDDLLRAVASRLRNVVRGDDMVARLGGDEFAIIMKGKLTEAVVNRVAGNICETLAEPIKVASVTVNISASIGITGRQAGAATAKEMVRQADAAMYRVKNAGRSGFIWYS
jgi:diguanylate cyclase (GGDEF)-like protein/PAS domain S-box-containing protein